MTESFAALLDENLGTLDMKPGSIVSGVVLEIVRLEGYHGFEVCNITRCDFRMCTMKSHFL